MKIQNAKCQDKLISSECKSDTNQYINYDEIIAKQANNYTNIDTTRKESEMSYDEFQAKLKEVREWASYVGYKESDVNDIIKSVRRERKNAQNCN